MQHMLKVQWYFILIPWKGNGSFSCPVPWLPCQPHPRTHHSMASHRSSITHTGISGDKQSKTKFLLCDKQNCFNYSSYIFHGILRLILQRSPKQFGLLTAVVAGLVCHFAFIIPNKDIQVTQTSLYMAQLLKALSSGFGGSGSTHSPVRECVCVCAAHLQELQRCLMSSVTEMLIFLRIKFHFMSYLRHLDWKTSTLSSWHFKFSSHKLNSFMRHKSWGLLWSFLRTSMIWRLYAVTILIWNIYRTEIEMWEDCKTDGKSAVWDEWTT